MRGQGAGVARAAAVLSFAALLLRPAHSFWPLEDSNWTCEVVNTSSLCTDPAVEDINPDDPAINLYSRRPQQRPPSLLQRVHVILGKSASVNGRSQVMACTDCLSLHPIVRQTVWQAH